MKMIEVSKLSFAYPGDSEVLSDVSFSIEKGQYISFIGHNGSGKSTLAKLLIGLLDKTNGEIFIDGEELNNKTIKNIRKKIALVFQNPDNQFIGSTVEDDIAFGLENRRVERDKMQQIINEYASKVGMIDYLSKEPSSLSGGQKQRVAIAGALALNPEILILDEATSMLDPRGKREISELIAKMREANKDLTVISITHDVEEAYQSDEVVVLAKGQVVLQGDPKIIFNDENKNKELEFSTPFQLELEQKLKKINIDISNAKNIKEIVEVLCQYK